MNGIKSKLDSSINELSIYKSQLDEEKRRRELSENQLSDLKSSYKELEKTLEKTKQELDESLDSRQRAEALEARLKDAKMLITESINRYEKLYRDFIALDATNKNEEYNEANLVEEISFITEFMKILDVNDEKKEKDEAGDLSESLTYCYATLEKVSRSFSVVIKQLTPELKNPICIFYLVLRALDTIEDDTKIELMQKLKWLEEFPSSIGNVEFRLKNVGDHPDYVDLMENYHHVAIIYNSLHQKYQAVIGEITKSMAQGMTHFVQNSVNTLADYDLYCHYVAGLVGIGLSKLFAASGHESAELGEKTATANSMGLFLQKTNITRDYAEDIEQNRCFWPREIWSNYTDDYKKFLRNADDKAVMCLNHMVSDAMRHFNDCLEYLISLKEPSVFKFCAIPQLMALDTLQLIYNNPLVYSQCLKISKSNTLRYFSSCSDMGSFSTLAIDIIKKWQSDPCVEKDSNLNSALNAISDKLCK